MMASSREHVRPKEYGGTRNSSCVKSKRDPGTLRTWTRQENLRLTQTQTQTDKKLVKKNDLQEKDQQSVCHIIFRVPKIKLDSHARLAIGELLAGGL
jgi:hypothetical protein